MHRFLMTKKEEKMTSALLLFKSSTVRVQNLHSRVGDLSAFSNLGITVFKKSHSRMGVLYEQEVGNQDHDRKTQRDNCPEFAGAQGL